MRAFTDTDLVQADTGSANLATSISVTLPAGTAEGNAGIIAMFAQTVIGAPDQWHIVATASSGLLAVMCRGDLQPGESSWPFSPAGGGSANWAWAVGEWGNAAASPPVETSASADGTAAASSLSTGNTGTFAAQYVMGVAAFGISNNNTTSAWPTVSYDNGFTETDSVQKGTGTTAGDLLLKVARRYGTDSDAGPWSCTATFTGDMSGRTPVAVLAVFRAQETALPPLVLAS